MPKKQWQSGTNTSLDAIHTKCSTQQICRFGAKYDDWFNGDGSQHWRISIKKRTSSTSPTVAREIDLHFPVSVKYLKQVNPIFWHVYMWYIF